MCSFGNAKNELVLKNAMYNFILGQILARRKGNGLSNKFRNKNNRLRAEVYPTVQYFTVHYFPFKLSFFSLISTQGTQPQNFNRNDGVTRGGVCTSHRPTAIWQTIITRLHGQSFFRSE